MVRDARVLERVRRLAIPPAWTDVWICALPHGHLQATGRDARGRKQYRYHARWRALRDETKYHRMLAFGRALPAARRRVEADLARSGLPRERVLAAVVRLLDDTCMRIGNEEYARTNGSFGITTLRSRHVKITPAGLRLRFRGKSGVVHDVRVSDRRLARIVRRCREIPGQELFQYLDDDGEPQPITSADVNDYLRDITGDDFTTKDFRTWAGSRLAVGFLAELSATPAPDAAVPGVALAKYVARHLGNTPAVCRKSYLHPGVLRAAEQPELLGLLLHHFQGARATASLRREEGALVAFLADDALMSILESTNRRS